jgi:predicted esterase
MHKKSTCILPIINSATAVDDSTVEVIEINSDTVRLETQNENGTWKDVGPINLLDENNMMNTNKTSLSTKKVLSSSTKTILGLTPNSYTFRHSHDGIDTNLLIFFHGAGDSHVPFDSLGRQIKLPQTATLSLSASMKMKLPPSLMQSSSSSSSSFVELPFGLGYTWFEEMDYKLTGEVLTNDHPQRITSLRHAVKSLDILLSSLTDQNNESSWIPERIFLFGFSSGACLAMELCRLWKLKRRMPFGGCICIAGGIKTISLTDSNSDTSTATSPQESQNQQFTDVLIITGSKDTTFTPKEAQKTKSYYDESKVKIHIQEGKGHGMIRSRQEMQVVMEFLSKRLVRRMASMEGMSSC